jgi:uncharacterized membrane protein YcaP (DUF421 family)
MPIYTPANQKFRVISLRILVQAKVRLILKDVRNLDFEEILRDTWQTGLVFFSLLIFTRILGKTQVGQLTFYEYINGITIGSIAGSIASADPEKVWSHYYDLMLFVALTYMISLVTIKSRPLRKLIEGSPTVVIDSGSIIMENMRGMRYDLDELLAQLREKGVTDISQVQYAIVETSGEMSVIKKSDYEPLTKSDLNIHLPDPKMPIELIMDGEIVADNLADNDLSETWLTQQLSLRNIKHIDEVSYAVLDSKGQLFIIKKQKNSLTTDAN